MSNYSLNNVRRFNFILNEDEYWDMHLNNDSLGDYSFSGLELDNDCLSVDIDTTNEQCVSGNSLNSIQSYKDACSYGLDMKNIGFTGVDNGLISYKKDRISNRQFYNLYTSSEYKVDSADTYLHLHAVTGNTGQYEYPTSINEDGSIKLNGGFYQGFFSNEKTYNILPTSIESEWNFEFQLKPIDYGAESIKTLNDKYPENKGIFFYIGTRAQNKWIYLYNKITSGDTDDKCQSSGKTFSLITKDLDLSEVEFKTDTGFELDSANDGYIVSDNKFLIFDRTCTGITLENYEGNEEVMLQYKTKKNPYNLFMYLNHTPSGYCANNIDELVSGETESYSKSSFYKDIYENALAFFIDANGAIGYKYIVKDCSGDPEGYFSVEMGKSYDNIVEKGKWSKINVKIKASEKYMKIYFYVNNKLKYITKNLPKLNLHKLDELDEKQEGVAYNISIGGGTQGLIETILPNYMDNPTEEYTLEKYFGGSFIGDFKSFKFYTC